MNRQPSAARVCLGLVLGCAMALLVRPAAAQTSVLEKIKSAASISAADSATIEQFVDTQVKQIASGANSEQGAARDALLNELSARVQSPTAAYLTAYTKALSDAVVAVPETASAKSRLNLAITVAKAAEKTQSVELTPAVMRMLQDPIQPVVIWGIKAAGSLLPAALASPSDNPGQNLIQAVTQAAQQAQRPDTPRALSAAILGMAYDALSLRVFEPGYKGPTVPPAGVQATANAVLALLKDRQQRYVSGTPVQPDIDHKASNFLVFPSIWQDLAPDQRVAAVQCISDLLYLSAQRYTPDSKSQFLPVINAMAQALYVIGERAGLDGDPAGRTLVAAATPLAKLSPAVSLTDVLVYARAIQPAIAAIVAFKSVAPPPTYQPAIASEPSSDLTPAPDETPAATTDAAQSNAPAPDNAAPEQPAAPEQSAPAPAP